MATKQEKWQEIANRGLQDKFDPDTRARFDEAVRRGLITLPNQQVDQPQKQQEIQQPTTSPELNRNIFGMVTSQATPQDIIDGNGLPNITTAIPQAIAETAANQVSSGVGAIVGGVSGAASLPFTSPQEAAELSQDISTGMASQPRSELGQDFTGIIQKLGEVGVDVTNDAFAGLIELSALATGQGLDNAVSQGKSVQENGISKFLSEAVFETTGNAGLAAIVEGLPVAILSALGIKSSKVSQLGKSKQIALHERFKKGSTDKDMATLRYEKIDDFKTDGKSLPLHMRNVVTDNTAKQLIKHGVQEIHIPPVRNSLPTDRRQYFKMLDVSERMMKNGEYAQVNHPLDVVGGSLMKRYEDVSSLARKSGTRVGVEALKLKTQSVDFSPAVANFEGALNAMGVKFVQSNGRMKLDFTGSQLKGKTLSSIRSTLDDVVEMMNGEGTPNGFQVHQLKKYIDELTDYDKASQGGLSGSAERAVGALRKDLDKVLDGKFPDYDKANTTFADSKSAIKEFEKVIGRNIDYTNSRINQQVGQELRKIGSNYGKRVPILNSVEVIEGIATKYGYQYKDNIQRQVMFANGLSERFALDRINTLKAQTKSSGIDSLSVAGVTDKAIKYSAKKLMKKDDAATLVLWRKFLKEQQDLNK